MNRAEVQTLLDTAGAAGEACKTALRLGAELTVFEARAPAFEMLYTWGWRYELLRENGVGTVGYEVGLEQLAEYGSRPVRLGRVRLKAPVCSFILFFAADEPCLVACVGHGDLNGLGAADANGGTADTEAREGHNSPGQGF
ncbi:hypothetical protein GCM10010399_51780 [Dactylosporangium fulvum]